MPLGSDSVRFAVQRHVGVDQEIDLHMGTSYKGFLNTGIASLEALVNTDMSLNGKAHAVAS